MTTLQALTPPLPSPSLSLALNEDILLMLPSYIRNKKTLHALMRTCRQLYAVGMPWILRLRHQLTPHNLRGFYTFLLVNPRPRFSALRDLDFMGGITRGEKKIIADIIRRAINLTALRIDVALLLSRHKICASVTTLRKLEQLQVDNVFEQDTKGLLSSLRGPLKRIYVQDYRYSQRSMIRFSEFRSTLERIVCSGGFRPTKGTFPNVVSFRQASVEPAMSILTAFPNLKILILKNQRDPFNHISRVEDDLGFLTHEARRRANIAIRNQRGSWDSLVYLDIDAVCLYTLAPQCRVTYLVIKKLTLYEDRSLTWFHTSLAAMRPTYLRIHTVVGEACRFAEVLASGMEDVRKLWMNLVIPSQLHSHFNAEIMDYDEDDISQHYWEALVSTNSQLASSDRVSCVDVYSPIRMLCSTRCPSDFVFSNAASQRHGPKVNGAGKAVIPDYCTIRLPSSFAN